MIEITRRGQWQLTQMIRVGCILGRIAIRPNGGRKDCQYIGNKTDQ